MSNMPKLRFSSFNDTWKKHSISEVLEVIERPLKMLDDEKYSLVTVKRRNEGIVRRDFLYGKEIKVKNQFIVKEKDLLISKRQIVHGAIGIVPAQLDGSIVSNEYHAYHTKDGFDLAYFNYLAKRPNLKKSLFLSSDGVDIEKLLFKNNTWFKWQFHFPTLAEQQKIASFLSKVDKKISLLTKKKDKLAEYKKGVMQQLFNGKWEEYDGQLTFIPPTLRFKADDGSEFPDWEEKKLGSLADLTSSKRVYLSDYSEDGVPFFRGKEISEIRKGIIPDDVLYITREAFEEFKSKYGAPVEGDILVTAVGTLANILRVSGEFEFYFKDGNLIWLRKPRCDSKFLSILMEANKHELLKTAIGSNQKALTIVELKKIVFKMPSLEEQQKITMFLSSLEEKVRLANSELEKAREWKNGLLQQMFV